MDNLEQVEDVDEVKELLEKVPKPKVGMCFNSSDEMFKCYKAYGLQEGFFSDVEIL